VSATILARFLINKVKANKHCNNNITFKFRPLQFPTALAATRAQERRSYSSLASGFQQAQQAASFQQAQQAGTLA
jgi:hypothetical protein